MQNQENKNHTLISVIGLGYVGLPVAVALAEKNKVVGFDLKKKRVEELKNKIDRNGEVTAEELSQPKLKITSELSDLKECTFHIIAVPTPVDDANIPDLSLLQSSSEFVGEILKKGDIVVYESTVYPGTTEEFCIPILEKVSGLKSAVDFFVGYSPERINPGDHEHTFKKIKKVVSAQTKESLKEVSRVYASVVSGGIYEASSIKVAEAAKVLENTQRDINIALMNELALICDLLDMDTLEVLEAAKTKWNFLNFSPGLVGGHCIGVDPYYLTYQAEKHGYHPQVILSGRRVNDQMGKWVANKIVKTFMKEGNLSHVLKVTILGLTFKENCSDIRNSKVFDIIDELLDFGVQVELHDPLIHLDELSEKYRKYYKNFNELQKTDALLLAVKHDVFKQLDLENFSQLLEKNATFYDLKGLFPKEKLKDRGIKVWRL